MKKDLKDRIVECFKDYLGDDLLSIVLFGSQARGDGREDSDYDLFVICKHLPASPLKRVRFIRKPIVGKFEERLAIVARTKDEVEEGFPSLFLDIGLDGQILYDRDYFSEKLVRIRNIIDEAGLIRKSGEGGLHWEWTRQPKGLWEIDWRGYREL